MSTVPGIKGEFSPDISTCNISDAMSRGGSLGVFEKLNPSLQTVYGKAVTCETPDGDWWAVAKAIDTIAVGDILVATSTGGISSAIMGELLANSAKVRGASAIVIDGAVRDIDGLRKLLIPIYARSVVPNAGDPNRKGRVGSTIVVNGVEIGPGDIIACDESGVVCIPQNIAADVLKKASEIPAKELEARKQILEGKKISDILNF